ncbi:melanoma-associated antigen B1-like [Acinonyx jubatus]|uniref:Melanoma-associated antigen B1-like n=1 Tax=Acinonyx jubatus TaxID=32536 RepID=A0A6J1YYR3_ACIJB|nr:melanoma-associated antigen B1-like [Acinonyx jubatus]XP_053058181.1 melanoma-associated antigen B1-like [Acinonyx jubatus]XP_053058182.1 melanoma-associated antigen B1-like [Acinonyx jubatus]
MPHRQKKKLRARQKRHEGQGEGQGVEGAQAAAAAAAEASPGSPRAGAAQQPQGAPAPGSPGSPGSPGAGAASPPREQGAEGPAAPPAPGARKDPLSRKADMLVRFLLERHASKEPITRAALLKIVSRKYEAHWAEILRRTSERLQLLFGLELREGDAGGRAYELVSKPGLEGDGGDKGPPKSGLVMALLGVIFMKGNRASEEEVWEFLNVLGVYAGRRHPIFGEPRKFITQDLVRQKYLEYRHVPGSKPQRYEFLWGPRARAHTSKMEVLQVLAKINDTVPSCFPQLYQEALLEEAARESSTDAATEASAGEAAGGPSGAGEPSRARVGRGRPI